MADPNTRTGKRTPVTLKIKFKSETLEQFIERYAVDVSQGGIFIRTKEPLAVGTQMRFEFQLKDATPLIAGEGTVVWTRENDPSRPAIAPGMGVRFDRLAEGSQGVLERILAEKAKQAPHRPASESVRPPLFTDQPTRVAPAPLAEQLLASVERSRRNNKAEEPFKDQQTPLPKPMPFHTDADEFPEEAFEEATKVRALDELVAQTAEAQQSTDGTQETDELAVRRASKPTPAPEPAGRSPFDESAPGLPNPPEPDELDAPPAVAAKPGRLLDATPSPRTEAPETLEPEAAPPAESPAAKTKLGLEAPRMHTPAAIPAGGSPAGGATSATASSGSPRTVPSEPAVPARPNLPAKSPSATLVILILILLAAGTAAVWFFVLRDKQAGDKPSGGSAMVASGSGPGSAPAVGSSGSNQLTDPNGAGTNPDSGSAKVEPPKGPTADTVVESNVPKSKVEVLGADQKGDAPFTAKLEKGKTYKVRISAPGYASLETDVVGGAPKTSAVLVPKPRIIMVTTDPAGALITVEGVPGAKLTPQDIELPKPPPAGRPVRIRLSKKGYKPVDKALPLDAFREDDTRMVAIVDEKLQVQQAVVRPPGGGSGPGPGTGSGTPPGDGSATPPPPPPPPPGDGSAAAPAGGGAAPPKEPEPSL